MWFNKIRKKTSLKRSNQVKQPVQKRQTDRIQRGYKSGSVVEVHLDVSNVQEREIE